MRELPADVQPYRRTPLFTAETVPAALLKDHATKAGVWGVITVLAGRLVYTIPATAERHVLAPDSPGIVEPQQLHHVTPDGDVSFYVEFYR